MKLYHLLSLILGIILVIYIIYLKVKIRKIGFKKLRLQMILNSERDLLLKCETKLKEIKRKNIGVTVNAEHHKSFPKTIKESFKKTISAPKQISQYNKSGDIIANFKSLRDASKKTKITRYSIKKSCDNPKDINRKTYFRYTK